VAQPVGDFLDEAEALGRGQLLDEVVEIFCGVGGHDSGSFA
jgi:hypothetical protein